jgi:subtilisin family serine protease
MLTLIFTSISLCADFYYSGGKKHILKKVKTSRALGTNNEYSFQTELGRTITVNRGIIVSYTDKSIRQIIEQKYNLTFVKTLTDKMYLYRIKDVSKTVETANLIYEEDGVEFCHPDFQRTKMSRALTNDPYTNSSWHLLDKRYRDGGDVNIEQAWQYTKGAGVKVAVYDKGIDLDHPDLRENIFAFKNYNDPDSDIPYSDDDTNWHGTACAGILSASENRIGGVGIAPQSSLYAVGYSDNNISKDIEAYQWMMNEGVSVINNSWGSYSALDAYTAIFKELATKGRDGKGVILIFASGNKAEDLDQQNINDESESPYVFSIAASTRQNSIASYSNYGKAVDFTAPGGSNGSGIFTTDARGSIGYNGGDYNQNFIGTSAAAPIVTGTIALMLAINPKLTRDDVFKILKFTAQKKGNYPYDENGHNVHWGYGKINAGAAVEVAYSYGNSNLKNFARTMFNSLLK